MSGTAARMANSSIGTSVGVRVSNRASSRWKTAVKVGVMSLGRVRSVRISKVISRSVAWLKSSWSASSSCP
jgi:hypothetical protein